MTPFVTPPSMITRNRSRRNDEGMHGNGRQGCCEEDGCMANCSSMFCGTSHFNKQERILSKFVKNPLMHTNQEFDSDLNDGNYSMTLSESYSKRKMFTYACQNENQTN